MNTNANTSAAWDSFVGIPFVRGGRDLTTDGGLDCWGLIRLAYKRLFDIELTECRYYRTADPTSDETLEASAKTFGAVHGRSSTGAMIGPGAEPDTELWQKVPDDEVRAGDVILFQVAGLPLHVGIFIRPGWMLHSRYENIGSTIERYTSAYWKNRVLGYYRYSDK